MYSGPLKFQFYPDIPVGITAAFSSYGAKKRAKTGSSKRRNNATEILSFVDVLESLAGSKICNYLGEL